MTTNTLTILCLDCRTSGRGDVKLIASSGWAKCPKCGYQEPLPEDIVLRKQGQPQLPGFGQ